ncbi:MAG: PKD domain-containing protein [Bacteroidota bacterium]
MRYLLTWMLGLLLLSGGWVMGQNSVYVAGNVVDTTGTPVPNFQLVVIPDGSSSPSGVIYTGLTDVNGHYLIDVQLSPVSNQVDSLIILFQNCITGSVDQVVTPGAFVGDTIIYDIITACDTNSIVNPGTCTASFSHINYDDTVQFSSLSQGAGLSYFWDFGDSTSSTLQDPLHVYSSPGVYYACLTITDSSNNCTDTYCDNIFISNNQGTCTASFTTTVNQATAQFVNTSVGSGFFLNSEWLFGDGNTSTSNNPVYTYSQAGTYNVSLIVLDPFTGCTDTTTQAVTVGNPPPCQAAFISFVSIDSAIFISQSIGSSNIIHNWDFGDGTTGIGQVAAHFYTQPDTYRVCLTITDSISGCTDDTCEWVVVVGNQPTCDPNFTYADLGGNNIQFFDLGRNSGSTYFWDFGDGNTSTLNEPIHTYAQPGVYNVCRTVSDPATGCTNTQCNTVIVIPPTCDADFSVYYDSVPNSMYFDAIYQQAGYTYTWDFGDGTTATGVSAYHTYASAGSYNVCLTVTDGSPSASCADTVCKVLPTAAPPSIFGVLGLVNLPNGLPADDFTAYLIVLDTVAGTLTAVDTFVSDANLGPFFFFGAPAGDYRVKVALNPTSAFYANHLPTYYGDDPFWFNATVVNQNTFPLLDIMMVAGTNPGGPGFVGGLISQGANRTSTNMVEGIAVVLTDLNNKPIESAMTNASGEYQFGSVAEGNYRIHVDMWGKSSEYYEISIAQGQINYTGLDFEFNDSEIWKTGVATGVDPELEQAIKVFPNPARDLVRIELGIDEVSNGRIELINSLGQRMEAINGLLGGSNREIKMDVSQLPAGLYHINISADDKLLVSKRLIVEK